MGIKERLRLVLDTNHLKIKEVSDRAGIPYRTLQNYLLSDRNVSIDALAKLYTYIGININWLLTGQGEMYERSAPAPMPALPQDIEEIVGVWAKLNTEQKQEILLRASEMVRMNTLELQVLELERSRNKRKGKGGSSGKC